MEKEKRKKKSGYKKTDIICENEQWKMRGRADVERERGKREVP